MIITSLQLVDNIYFHLELTNAEEGV